MTTITQEQLDKVIAELRYNYAEYKREESASVGYNAKESAYYFEQYTAKKRELAAMGYTFNPTTGEVH